LISSFTQVNFLITRYFEYSHTTIFEYIMAN